MNVKMTAGLGERLAATLQLWGGGHLRVVTIAMALTIVACSATAPSDVAGNQPPAPSAQNPSTQGASTTCEVAALDGERFLPPVTSLTVRVGQTITFTGRLMAFGGTPLPPPPYTYSWKTFGGSVFGQQSTNDPQNSIQHVFTSAGSPAVSVEVTGNSYSIVFPNTSFCQITVVPRP